jgi:hypothetical protein
MSGRIKRAVSVHGETFNMVHLGNLAVVPNNNCMITITPRQVGIRTPHGQLILGPDGRMSIGTADEVTKKFQEILDEILKRGETGERSAEVP